MTELVFKQYETKFYENFPKITVLESGQNKEEIIGKSAQWWQNEKPEHENLIEWSMWRPRLVFKEKK